MGERKAADSLAVVRARRARVKPRRPSQERPRRVRVTYFGGGKEIPVARKPRQRKRAPRDRQAKRSAHSAARRAVRAGNDRALRAHILYLLRGGGAHVNFERATAEIPVELRGVKPAGLPYTLWQLLEHLRISQGDILEFCINSKHVSPEWPAGYWPATDAPPDAAAWLESVEAFRRDLKAMEKLVENPSTDLYAKIPHGEGQTILREALLVADHNAYHLGQIVAVRRLLGAWEEEK